MKRFTLKTKSGHAVTFEIPDGVSAQLAIAALKRINATGEIDDLGHMGLTQREKEFVLTVIETCTDEAHLKELAEKCKVEDVKEGEDNERPSI